MFQAISHVSAPRSTSRAREIKTSGFGVSDGAEIKTGGRNQIDAIPAANPIERQVIPSGTRHEHQAEGHAR
jgi:hypothetical protein